MPTLCGRDSPTGVSSTSSKRNSIQFAETLVTGVSRPMTNTEHWALYNFESHAFKCRHCRKPSQVQKENRQLCSEGRTLATEVTRLLFTLRSDGKIYRKSNSEHQEIRIEVPADYKNVTSLLKVIRREGNGILKKQQSYDRTYLVQPRLPPRKETVRPHEWHGYPTETVRPKSSTGHRKHKKSKHSTEKTSRGSLYDYDQLILEEQARRERLERYDLAESRWPFMHISARRAR